MALAIVIGSVISAFCLTGVIRRYALRTTLVDRPVARSSHSRATPLGGGLAIVAVLFCGLLLLLWFSPSDWRILAALMVSLVIMAGLGWIDDRHGLPMYTRLSVQILVGTAVVLGVGPIETLDIGGFEVRLYWLSVMFSVIWFVWLTNLYNFMDGIDGLAAVQAVIAGGTLGYWFSKSGSASLSLFSYAVMGATLGFLVWNWAPAKIFMGDAGSLALGAILAVLSVTGISQNEIPWGAFLILMGIFLADATVTLIRRILSRQRWWEAHRTHFYQRAVQAGWSHGHVSFAALLASIILAALGTLEMLRYPPRELWIFAAALLLLGLAALIKRKEFRSDQQNNGHCSST